MANKKNPIFLSHKIQIVHNQIPINSILKTVYCHYSSTYQLALEEWFLNVALEMQTQICI